MRDLNLHSHLAYTAESHRRLAEAAGTVSERAHWEGEADRFQQLADLAVANPEAARQAYRPARAFQND